MKPKMILIAAPDREELRRLGAVLHERGYDVRAARDGSQALEKAVLARPDLIVFDDGCQLVSLETLLSILRRNPKTESIPLLILASTSRENIPGWGCFDAQLAKPVLTAAFIDRVSGIFGKMATSFELSEGGGQVEGSLTQIQLSDLLQVFLLHRKTGMLALEDEGRKGCLFVQDGQLVSAWEGKHQAEKALFRLMEWADGHYSFAADQITADVNIRRPTDILLQEGRKQLEELGRLKALFLERKAWIVPALQDPDVFIGQPWIFQEILSLCEFYHTPAEVVEHSRAVDLDAYMALDSLLEKGLLKWVDAQWLAEELEPLLDHHIQYELKYRISQWQATPAQPTRAKLCLFCPSGATLRSFMAGLSKLPGMEWNGDLGVFQQGFGQLGTLHLGENLGLDWVLLPAATKLQPLWKILGVGMVGGMVVRAEVDEEILGKLQLLGTELCRGKGIPVVQFSPETIRPQEGEDANRESTARGFRVRLAVTQLLRQIAGAAPLREAMPAAL